MSNALRGAESIAGSVEPSTLQIGTEITTFVTDMIENVVAFLPRLIAAAVILLIGWFIGKLVAKGIRALVDKSGLDAKLVDTPVGRFMGGRRDAVANVLGKVGAYYIYLLALVAAADALAIPVLSNWVARAVAYVPALIAGLLVILVGFVVADFIGDAIDRSQTVTDNRYTSLFADGVRFFLYFVVITIGLDTIGIDTELLYILAQSAAYGLGAALALGLGLAIGLGGSDYVDEHIDGWLGSAKESAKSSADSHSGTGGSAGSAGATPTDGGSTVDDVGAYDDRDSGSGTPTGDD